MDASYKIQRGIHVHLIQFFMCPEFWVHISGPLRFLRLFEVEESVHTQILRHVALVVAKSAPVGTPMRGHPSLRSLAPPLKIKPASLGFDFVFQCSVA